MRAPVPAAVRADRSGDAVRIGALAAAALLAGPDMAQATTDTTFGTPLTTVENIRQARSGIRRASRAGF